MSYKHTLHHQRLSTCWWTYLYAVTAVLPEMKDASQDMYCCRYRRVVSDRRPCDSNYWVTTAVQRRNTIKTRALVQTGRIISGGKKNLYIYIYVHTSLCFGIGTGLLCLAVTKAEVLHNTERWPLLTYTEKTICPKSEHFALNYSLPEPGGASGISTL